MSKPRQVSLLGEQNAIGHLGGNSIWEMIRIES